MLKRKWVFMAEAGDGTDGTAGDAATSAAADALPAAGTETAVTALSQGAAAPLPPAIPEKYIVKKEDGTVDTVASSLKLAEAYKTLEKRIGSGDMPPKTPAEYKITVPDALKDTWKPAEDKLLQGFLTDAHAAGLSQKQIDLVMGKYMEIAPDLVQAGKQLDFDSCNTELKAEWKTDDQYKSGISNAYKAATAYFGTEAEAIIAEYGNDARIIRGLAKIGAEIGEDRSNNFEGQLGQGSIDSILSSEAYNQPRHPDHAKVSEQVRKHFESIAKAAERAGTQIAM